MEFLDLPLVLILIDGRLSSEGVVGEECICCENTYHVRRVILEMRLSGGSVKLNAMKKHEPEGSRDSPSPKSIVETPLCMSPDLFPTNFQTTPFPPGLGLARGPSKRSPGLACPPPASEATQVLSERWPRTSAGCVRCPAATTTP